MTCTGFEKPAWENDIECSIQLTSSELTIISNALHYYCKQEGKELLSAQRLHRDVYGINSFIRAGKLISDDKAITVLDNAVKRLQAVQ